MQTETPLYVTDVLGEIDNSETTALEPQVRSQRKPSRGPALLISDRRVAAKRDREHGSFFEWLALGVLAAVIVALLATSNIGQTFITGINGVITKITGTTGTPAAPTKKDCNAADKKADQKKPANQQVCK